jgi:ribosomal protein S12 methylthiotransferase accessory factor
VKLDITFPGGARVRASLDGLAVDTDQMPGEGGEGSAPSPFDLFLASVGACAGSYVLAFLRRRKIPAEGVRLVEHVRAEAESGMVDLIEIEILVPEGFPEKLLPGMVRSAELCAVKKHFEHPPKVAVKARRVAPTPA